MMRDVKKAFTTTGSLKSFEIKYVEDWNNYYRQY